jgi:hypothetical protein
MKSNQNPEKNDLTTAIISNITVVVQIIAVGAIGLADMLKIHDLFQLKELINIANFAILLLSLSLIGLFNYFRTNKDFKPEVTDQEKGWVSLFLEKIFGKRKKSFIVQSGSVKKFLGFLYFLTLISTFAFFYFTYVVVQNKDSSSATLDGLFQVITYSITLIGGSVIIYVWINDMLDKKQRFTEEDLVPNFKDTLIKYEFIGTPSVKIKQNDSLNYGNRLLRIEIGDEGHDRYFETSFDGKRIFKEMDKSVYEQFFKNPNNNSEQS